MTDLFNALGLLVIFGGPVALGFVLGSDGGETPAEYAQFRKEVK